jgi:hypothetical protein
MKLYAICWQDSHEPWGWAPATNEEFGNDVTQIERVFFWDRGEAEAALRAYIEMLVPAALAAAESAVRQQHERAVRAWEANRKYGPGARLEIVTLPHDPRLGVVHNPPLPRPEIELPRPDDVREHVKREWSVQEYEVPAR